jgi:hypothetical protein
MIHVDLDMCCLVLDGRVGFVGEGDNGGAAPDVLILMFQGGSNTARDELKKESEGGPSESLKAAPSVRKSPLLVIWVKSTVRR